MTERRRQLGAIVGSSVGWLHPIVSAFVDMVEPAVARLAPARRWVVVELDDDRLAFHQSTGSRTLLVGTSDTLDDRQRRLLSSRKADDVELRLRADKVIETTIRLPAAGMGHIGQIVAHRLDRLTPWHPDRLLYGFAAAVEPGIRDQINVDFVATSRDIAAESIRRLEPYDLVPSRIGSAAEPVDRKLRIDLFRGSNDVARKRRRRTIVAGVAALPVMSLLACLVTGYLLLQGRQQLADLDDRLTSARLVVSGSANSGDRQRDLALMDAKTPDTAQFALIDRLARIVPDTAYLDELNIEQNSVRLVGSSTEASALIPILEADPALSDATFAAPVTRQADGRDRFDVTAARVAPARKAAP